jgi:hypothetical protein
VELIDEARGSGYKPEDSFEWLTFIEAQALTGNMAEAEKLSRDAFKQENGIRRGLCVLWKRLQIQNEQKMQVDEVLSEFECTQVE